MNQLVKRRVLTAGGTGRAIGNAYRAIYLHARQAVNHLTFVSLAGITLLVVAALVMAGWLEQKPEWVPYRSNHDR